MLSPRLREQLDSRSPQLGSLAERICRRVQPPEDLQCKLRKTLLRDPVVTSLGNTYERCALYDFWRASGGSPAHRVDPAAPGEPLLDATLAPDLDARRRVQAFLDDHPGYIPDGWPDRDLPPPGGSHAVTAMASAMGRLPRLAPHGPALLVVSTGVLAAALLLGRDREGMGARTRLALGAAGCAAVICWRREGWAVTLLVGLVACSWCVLLLAHQVAGFGTETQAVVDHVNGHRSTSRIRNGFVFGGAILAMAIRLPGGGWPAVILMGVVGCSWYTLLDMNPLAIGGLVAYAAGVAMQQAVWRWDGESNKLVVTLSRCVGFTSVAVGSVAWMCPRLSAARSPLTLGFAVSYAEFIAMQQLLWHRRPGARCIAQSLAGWSALAFLVLGVAACTLPAVLATSTWLRGGAALLAAGMALLGPRFEPGEAHRLGAALAGDRPGQPQPRPRPPQPGG